jgi:hypothetical protein
MQTKTVEALSPPYEFLTRSLWVFECDSDLVSNDSGQNRDPSNQ